MQAFPRARVLLALAFVTTLTGVFAVGASTAATAQELGKTMTTPSGLQITDTKMGAGATPRPGQIDTIINVDLPRPRDKAVITSQAFTEYADAITERFMAQGVIQY